MQIVIFAHPNFLSSKSMPLFAGMIYEGMLRRGHQVKVWKPNPIFYRLPVPNKLKKWLGYIDQFFLFPLLIRLRVIGLPKNTLFVFADQALGPWVPLVKNRPHVIHCHDFMALRSALGFFPQNPVSFTGRLYQKFIRWGFSQGKNFISVSDKTREDLHGFLSNSPTLSVRVYNGLNYPYARLEAQEAHTLLLQQGWEFSSSGFLLHVGGNQWYKNREGVLRIYSAYCHTTDQPLPLCLIGPELTTRMIDLCKHLPSKAEVRLLTKVPTQAIQAAYSLASALVFPSIAEGFGWPIAEAMACGCPVLTTGEAPMTEVGGDVATYLPIMPSSDVELDVWSKHCAEILNKTLQQTETVKKRKRDLGYKHNKLFDTEKTLDSYETIYKQILECEVSEV